jgi:hypothetical protein
VANCLQLVDVLDHVDIDVIFDIVHDLTNKYILDRQVYIKTYKISSTRILKELKSTSLKNRKTNGHNIIITKCFILIRTLTTKEELVLSNLSEIETFLEPIFNYMKVPKSINFEEELFEIMKNIMNFTRSATPLAQMLFPNLVLYYQKANTLGQEFFELVCCYIKYGSEIINSNQLFCQLVKYLIN